MPRSNGDLRRVGARSGGEDQSLIRYIRVLRERLWVIVACTALVAAAAVAYVELAPKTYQAQATLLVQAASSNDSVLSGLPVLHSTGDPTQDVLTGAGLITTQPVAVAVVHALHLKLSPSDALGDVQASPIGQTDLVAVQATASSPSLAQRLATAFVQQRIALSTARMHAAIAAELPSLQAQVAAVPAAQRYGAGGQQVNELESLQHQNDPTFVEAAEATLPTAPASPKTKLSIAAGVIAGLLIGVGVAFLLHALDPRLRREEQLRERFDLPVLARIPRQPKSRPRPLLPSELSFGAHEGYRTLRTTIAARSPAGESRAVLVTGAAPSEGKSTTAMGLAAAFAHGGARVILVEADLRKPTLAASLHLPEFTGIEEVLAARADLLHAATPIRIEGAPVRVVAAHPATGDILGGLSFAVVRKLIADAKAIADVVVIDSAPLTEVIDALPFAQAADEVVIVARMDQTRLHRLDELDDLLAQHGVARTGIVLIGDHPMRGAEYYYGNGAAPSAPAARAAAMPEPRPSALTE
jgi:tyrosine-protein kinase